MLQRPAHQDLCDILVVPACDVLQDMVVELSADERAVRLHKYAMLAAVFDDWPLLAEWVHLYLVDGGHIEACTAKLFKVFDPASQHRGPESAC